MLNRFYDAMAVEIAEAGGTIEKFIGDAVVAAFGAPAAQEDHVDRALHAALAMRRRLEELFGDSLRLRIGVNTGDVVLGQARVGSSFVTGDAVNVAARLEQSAEPGQILVGARTVANARKAFDFGPETTIEATKGRPTRGHPFDARSLRLRVRACERRVEPPVPESRQGSADQEETSDSDDRRETRIAPVEPGTLGDEGGRRTDPVCSVALPS